MPPIHTIPGRWRARCALTGVLAAVAVLCGMLPAGARTGLNWLTLPSLPTARYDVASAAAPCPRGQTGSCLYAVGGYNNGNLATVESYNRSSNTWSLLPHLPSARSSLGAAAAPCPDGLSGTCLYALGGSGGSRSVNFFNPAVNSWGSTTSLTTGRAAFGTASAPCPTGQTGTCVYVFGGIGTTVLASAEVFNPVTRSWTTLSPLSAPRYNLGAASAPCPPGQTGTCVYAVGGSDDNNHVVGTVEAYNPVTRSWSKVASLPTPREGLGVAATGCPPGQQGVCLYTTGGANETDVVDTAESYHPASGLWTSLPSLPAPRGYAGAAALPCPPGSTGNCVYFAGGYRDGGPAATLEALDPPVTTGR
ncbi:Kelch repeat-containing protein [Streptomyces sp. NBC_00582]|uniref:Kelch repeat-containing protein n=1 Tax=Streptomyces sp. NBC_00582 TaxID=2975783 RepID=UPI0010637E03|nr:kelch repeat-containing protein [Streptomyces sp. NBC_00582]WUB61326.1 hypothetical protein OG852_13475 [Streptomyces sp. NBC_00582]